MPLGVVEVRLVKNVPQMTTAIRAGDLRPPIIWAIAALTRIRDGERAGERAEWLS